MITKKNSADYKSPFVLICQRSFLVALKKITDTTDVFQVKIHEQGTTIADNVYQQQLQKLQPTVHKSNFYS